MSTRGSRGLKRPIRRVSSAGPQARRIATTDVVVVPAEGPPNMLAKRASLSGRARSVHLSFDLDNAEWQQKIMKTWPKKCTFVIREILQTERTYILSLEEIILGYMLPLHGYLLSQGEGPQFIHTVFSNIIKLQQIHEALLDKLYAACGDPHEFAAVFIDMDFGQYREYCTNFSQAQQYLQESLENRENLRMFIEQCQHDLEHSLPLHSHLIKPVQRILKYKLMLQEAVKDFDVEDVAYSDLKEALEKMRKVAEEINTSFNNMKEETAVSPATIAQRRSKEIKYLQTRRADRQRRTTLSDSPAEELQRSLEFEDSLTLLRSARSSSMQHSNAEGSARQATPNTIGVEKKPPIPINDIVGLIEAATPTEEFQRSQELEDSVSLLRSKCSDIAQQKRSVRRMAKTVGHGRRPRVPLTFPVEASFSGSSASSPASMSPSVAPSSSSVPQPFSLLPPKPLLERQAKVDEHLPKKAGEAHLPSEVPSSPIKKDPILPTKAPASPTNERSPSSVKKPSTPSNKQKEPILPSKQKSLISQPKEQGISRKYPLLPNKEKVEHLGKHSHRQPEEREQVTNGETGDRETAGKSAPIPPRPLPPPSPGVVKIERPPIPKKPTTYLLPDKKLPQKKAPPQGSDRQRNSHQLVHLGFPTKFVIDETSDGGPTVSLPPPSPLADSSSATFLPSMLKPLKNSAMRDSVFVRQKNIAGELNLKRVGKSLESFDQGKHSIGALKQSSIEGTEGGGEARKTPLLPPINHRDLPASAQVKLQATN